MLSYHKTRNLPTILIIMVLLTLFLSGCGLAKPKVYRVGVLSGLDFVAVITNGFKEGMADLGYVEGENIVYDIQKTPLDPAQYDQVLQKFVADDVDLIFVFPTEAAIAAKAATQGTDIPVLFANAFIEGFDIVDSVREPGGNITGVRYPSPDIAVKSLETLLEVAPQAKRIWLAYLDGAPTVPAQLEVLRPAAASLGVTLVEVPVTNMADLEADLQARSQAADPGVDAIMQIAEPVAVWPEATAAISKFAVEHQLAFHGTTGESIINLTVDPFYMGIQAAPMADKILKGTPAGTIPVVSADSVLTINYAAAQKLGVAVPEGLLKRADHVTR